MKDRSKKSKPALRQPPKHSPAKSLSSEPEVALGRRRLWLFRLLSLLLPVLALVGLEMALRVAGYGYSTSFFKKLRIENQDFLVQNDDFSLRFFPPEIARNPGPIRMRMHKPAGTYRIFIFGESAAMGDPEPTFSASRYLEVLLRERFPEGRFEVVNVAFTAINSHVILPIARECAKNEGDLWIIYMGNNEMVGPFGAATVFGAKAPPLLLVRATVVIQKTRLGQLLMACGRKLIGRSSKDASWGGMQMFLHNQISPDEPHKEAVYHHFRSNLEDIVGAGRASGAKIILSTVAVNLKDCPPLASISNSNLPAADRAQFEELYAEAIRAEGTGNFTEAASRYERASKLDPKFAELQFHWGQCLLELRNFATATHRFQLACDYDALPFRTDSRINDVIESVGREHASSDVLLMNASAALQPALETQHSKITTSPPLGQECFYEHVHLNFEGNYRLGRAWEEKLEELLPATVKTRTSSSLASKETCDSQLGLTDWNRSFVVQAVVRRLQQPPLSNQSNNGQRLESFRAQEKELRKRMNAEAAARVREADLTALKRSPDDYYLHESFADFLEAVGDFKQATLQWRQVQQLIPHDFLSYFQLGRMLERQGQRKEAISSLKQALKLRPTLAEGWFELGKIEAAEEHFDLALKTFNRACRLRPKDPVFCSYKAKVLSKLKRRPEAIQLYGQAIQSRPDYWEAHNALADELALDGKISEAMVEYEAVIRLQPDYAVAHLNLGALLVRQGRLDEAIHQFETTLRVDPGNKIAREYLQSTQAHQNAKP